LIALELFKFAEEVGELVESAAAEDKIEKKINKIQDIWDKQIFTFVDHPLDPPVPVLGDIGDIIEIVEADSLVLNSYVSNKNVGEFKERVEKQLKDVRTVDRVVESWMKVQKNWQRLEPIFIGSEDIKHQLPEHAKRFEGIDGAFKEMLRDAADDKYVISCCTTEGRQEFLDNTIIEIDLCERALTEYLSEKKKIFPRFYFASDQALLDILSNGNNPEIVDTQIGNLFDGLRNLKFLRGPGIQYPSRVATAMISNEGEEVGFIPEKFAMAGAVENYLNDLEAAMIKTLQSILIEAKTTAERMW
jgi:dynein heavy chain